MTYQAFRDAYVEYFKKKIKITDLNGLSEKSQGNLKFALSTNERAREIVDLVDGKYAPDWSRWNILDVGCAYGGICIESAKRGATAYGVDIVPDYIELAKTNGASLDLNATFLLGDICDRSVVAQLPHAAFDLVIINDVFEHVYDTAGLLASLGRLAAPGCKLYFAIPNGFCMKFIAAEGHNRVLGTSVLSPFLWGLHPGSGTNIFYRRWEHYVALLSHFGFTKLDLLNYEVLVPRPMQTYIPNQLAAIRRTLSSYACPGMQPQYKRHVALALDKLEQEIRHDLQTLRDDQLNWKYLITFWKGFAVFQADAAGASIA